MRRFLRRVLLVLVLLLLAFGGYGWLGYRDAMAAASEAAARADALIAAGQGGEALGLARRDMLLAVEDPAFDAHVGVDFTTPGAGITTITQSLAKRMGFDEYRPGLAKIRQTGYALGLERRLTKPQILALFLDTAEMGRGPDGDWITGFFAASEAHFGAGPAEIEEAAFLSLVAVLIAPGTLSISPPNPALTERLARIEALLAGVCVPSGHDDVWLEGCAGGA